MPKNFIDIIADRVADELSLPNVPFGGSTGVSSAPTSGNVVSRPNADTGATMEMWTPGDPFTDEYYFGGPYIPGGGVLV